MGYSIRFHQNMALENMRSLVEKETKYLERSHWHWGDKEKSKREFAVTELYPKLLYTFSDVVVLSCATRSTYASLIIIFYIICNKSQFT